MNKYKAIKYGILAILGVFAVYQIFPIEFGDYCVGLEKIMAFLFYCGLFSFGFLYFLLIDLILTITKKIKFDYIPCVILGVFIAVSLLFFQIENKKFWTKKTLIGYMFDSSEIIEAYLVLYENNTFSARKYRNRCCTYQGKYSIKQDTLILKRDDLPELTDKLFCNKYLIHQIDSTLIPLENGYKIIDLKKYETNSKLNLNLKKATQ